MEEREERELREKLERLKGGHAGSDAPAHHATAPSRKGILDNRYTFLAIVAAIVVLSIVLRLGLARYTGFFEPDGFFHYTVIGQSIMNHYIVPVTQVLSGFPVHNTITEPNGFYYMTIIPYIFLQFFGISYYSIMRYLPVLFGILDAFGAYVIVKYLTNSRAAGLIGMLLVGISSGDIARTAATVYRGDSFVTAFALLAFILLIKSMTAKERKRQYIYAIFSGIILGTAPAIWGGAVFVFVTYISAITLFIIYGFIKADEHLLRSTSVMALALLLGYAVEWLYIIAYVIRYVPSLGSWHFFIFYVPLLAGSFLAFYIVKRRHGAFAPVASTTKRRVILISACALVLVAALIAVLPGYLLKLSTAAIGTGPLGTTIQELQPPTWPFIWESFGWQVVLAPIGFAIFLLFGRKLINRENRSLVTVTFGLVAVYFLSTLYLQLGAIRYNSLVSVPFAILAAYAVYSAPKMLLGRRRAHAYAAYVLMGLFTALIIMNLGQTYINSFTSGQADGINPQFLQAMAWMYNNTATNATVLALWPDGSVVEGWAHRQSYMDSVNGQTESKIYNFSRWLFSTTPDPQYLINASSPQYFLVRGYWLQELGGIATEGGITNTSPYGYDAMTSVRIGQSANATLYYFNSSSYPYYNVELVGQHIPNSTATSYVALLGYPQSQSRFPLSNVVFVNQSGGPYSVIKPPLNNTLNYTFVVYYQGTTITGGALVGSKMPESNFFRFVVLCDYAVCPYNASGITMKVVYENADSKIIRINYT